MPIANEFLVELTSDIVTAHVSHNNVQADQLPKLIETVFAALQSLGAPVEEPAPEKPKGAVSARASVKPDHLVSLIDGKPYKTLKRHIGLHGYTPESYREAYDLPKDYPMVAAEYAARRSELAKTIGLGRKPGEKQKPRSRKANGA